MGGICIFEIRTYNSVLRNELPVSEEELVTVAANKKYVYTCVVVVLMCN